MSARAYTYILLIACLLSAVAAHYYWPTVRIQDREVIKHDVRTIIREVKRPDGSTETTTEIIDHTKEHSSTTAQTLSKNWFLTIGAQTGQFTQVEAYNAQLNYRIVGPFYAGLSATTESLWGAQFGVEF